LARYGSEKLQTLSYSCLYKKHPVFAVIVPIGGLNPIGYIQVIADLAYSLRKIEQSLAMPVQMNLLDGQSVIAVAQRIVDTLSKPFLIKNHSIQIECKTGISIYPTHGEDKKC
jgi:GGDEF domain-containing protein